MDPESDREDDDQSMVSSIATSFDLERSMHSASPVSVVSINSNMQFFKREYGRQLNNCSDIYHLPADREELERLDKQHSMFIDIMGDKYVPGMAEVLVDDIPGEMKACIDLGCGAGSWIIDVARDFPHCNAVAVDLIPMQVVDMPPNLRSEIDDLNLGLEHYYGDFNVVHARLISSGIRDYHRLVDQIARVVRSGGLIDLSEYDFSAYDRNHQRIEIDEDNFSPPWWARWLSLLRNAIEAKGGDINAATHLYDWVRNNPTLEEVVYREYFLPVVPPPREGAKAEFWLKFDKTMRENLLSFLSAGRPLLLWNGVSESLVTDLEQRVAQEIDEKKITQYTRLQCVYARKPAEPSRTAATR